MVKKTLSTKASLSTFTAATLADASILFGDTVTAPDGSEFVKNTPEIHPASAVMLGGATDFSVQDASNAIGNLPGYISVRHASGAIIMGSATTHARAFRTASQSPKEGWCYVQGFAGFERDFMTGAPHVAFTMRDPKRRQETAKDPNTGRVLGTKRTAKFTKIAALLRPDQSRVGMTAIFNPHGEAEFTNAAATKRVIDREVRRDAKLGATTGPSAHEPFAPVRTADGWAVRYDGSLQIANWEDLPFTGEDAQTNAETKARILNRQSQQAS